MGSEAFNSKLVMRPGMNSYASFVWEAFGNRIVGYIELLLNISFSRTTMHECVPRDRFEAVAGKGRVAIDLQDVRATQAWPQSTGFSHRYKLYQANHSLTIMTRVHSVYKAAFLLRPLTAGFRLPAESVKHKQAAYSTSFPRSHAAS